MATSFGLFVYAIIRPADISINAKGNANPLQALTDPVGSRRLRLPNFKTISI
jgi:hypothetical protein